MLKLIGMGMLLLAGQAAASDEGVGCKARQQGVMDQLAFAKSHDNGDQIAGLEQALANIAAHCTDAGLLKEQQQRVVELKTQVDERLVELQQARAAGKVSKIAKRQAKLAEAQGKLEQAQQELAALQQLVSA